LDNNFVFYLLGAIAAFSFISSNYALTRPWILILQTSGSLLVSVQFTLIGIWSVAIVNSVFIVRNIVLYSRELHLAKSGRPAVKKENVKWGIVFMFVLVPIYFITSPLVESVFADVESALLWLLPLIAGVTNILAIAQSKILNLKLYTLVTVSSWAVFDIMTGAWTTLVGDLFSAVACVIAIQRIKSTQKLKA
jgi:hypothetical protein